MLGGTVEPLAVAPRRLDELGSIQWPCNDAAPTGTPIYAAGDGVIEKAQWVSGYGRYTEITVGVQEGDSIVSLNVVVTASSTGGKLIFIGMPVL